MIFKDVYIASPPAEGGFLSILKEKFSFYGINVFIGLDLSRDLEDCYRLDSQVFSSIEQEICSKSTGFLYSPGSSWSLNTAIGKSRTPQRTSRTTVRRHKNLNQLSERNVRNETLSENLESILDFGKTNVNFKPDSKQENTDGLDA